MAETKKTETPQIKRATAFFSMGWILVTGLIVSFLIYRAHKQFISEDPFPELLPITPETQQKMGHPVEVKVGLYIKDFTEFKMLENEFEFSGTVWFLFDPSLVSLDTLAKFSFEKAKIHSKSEPTTRIIQGKLLARFDVSVSFKTNATYVNFPFDSHTLYIVFDNNAVSPGEISFVSSYNELALSPEIRITGWDLQATRVYTGYSVSALDKTQQEMDVAHPRIVFALEYVSSGIRQGLLIILPILLIFFMAMFTFSIDSAYYTTIISISSGAVTALLAYRFVIDRIAPQVGYFMQTDTIFFLFLVIIVGTFIINVGLPELRDRYTKLIVSLIHMIVIASFLVVLRG